MEVIGPMSTIILDETKRRKLYKVTLRGFSDIFGFGIRYKTNYVVAFSADNAHKLVKDFLKKRSLGFNHERELHSIELLAENYEYTDTQKFLFIEE